MRQFITVLCLLTLVLSALANQQLKVKIQDGSRIIINGSSNINRFTLTQTAAGIPEQIMTVSVQPTQDKIGVKNASISLPVRQFTTDDKMIQHSFYRMMQVDNHPTMNIRLKQIETPRPMGGKLKSKAQIDITITGITRSYLIPVETCTASDMLDISGTKRISIRDYGIAPPTAMMGMIRVCEWIDIQLELKCRIDSISDNRLAKQ